MGRATITPLERPNGEADKEFLGRGSSRAQRRRIARADKRNSNGRRRRTGVRAFWWDRGKSTGRTSLIVDPPDGGLPPLAWKAIRQFGRCQTTA